MATNRPMRASRTVRFALPTSTASQPKTVRWPIKATKDDGETRLSGRCGGRRPALAAAKGPSECVVAKSETQVQWGVNDIASLLANVGDFVLSRLRINLKQKHWRLQVQSFIERVIINCRFFTLFAIAGSLLGSMLCLLEGCFTVLESYYQYLRVVSHKPDGHVDVLHLLIEAVDLFLVGTAMLVIGVGLYAMFVGSKCMKQDVRSNILGVPTGKILPNWVEVQSISQAKSKIGHAMTLILQVGVLDKFKSIPLISGVDLACFAGALFVLSAGTYLLSRLAFGSTRENYYAR